MDPDFSPPRDPADEPNLYAAPQAEVHDPGRNPMDPVSIREEHVLHEASIKSVGCLYLLGGGLSLLYVAGLLFALTNSQGGSDDFLKVVLPITFVIGGVYLAVGFGMRSLSPGVKIPAVILSALAIFSFPCGTLLGIYAIYLVLSHKGSVVFSDEYKDVIAATPHVKARTPWYAWVALLAILGLIGLAFLGSVISRPH